jgi:UDP-2-acetamido-3-amino-2,3-dideoxy-glucuronate N-acetyltransferase
MTIGLVGLGYWGHIILKNFEAMGITEIVVCEKRQLEKEIVEKYCTVEDYKELEGVNKVFVLTPASQHFEICKHFLTKGVDVFCEKPLCLTTEECETLYALAVEHDCKLFVDWIFTFNNQLSEIKRRMELGEFGKPLAATFNRLNMGPVRHDVNARIDLAAHDLSILYWLFEPGALARANWIDYKRNDNSVVDDSCSAILTFENLAVSINVSWHYPHKERQCVFVFEKGDVVWDDSQGVLAFNGERLSSPEGSPLVNSINAFMTFTPEEQAQQKELTLKVTRHLS